VGDFTRRVDVRGFSVPRPRINLAWDYGALGAWRRRAPQRWLPQGFTASELEDGFLD